MVVAFALLATTPAHAQDNTGARLDALEQRVAHLEALAAKQQNQATELITLTRWSAEFAQRDLSKSYKITYTLQSHCQKPIKLIDGSLDFLDPDGKRIYSIPLIKEAPLDSGGAGRFAGNYFLNPALPDEIQLRDLPPAQVATQLHVRRIVFRDNSVLPLE
ncbi:MAG TPA: hypothetical protein VHW66_04750 [Stellaceae bacterium]|nr:hypothetical protein [Stellaceae bacterium]